MSKLRKSSKIIFTKKLTLPFKITILFFLLYPIKFETYSKVSKWVKLANTITTPCIHVHVYIPHHIFRKVLMYCTIRVESEMSIPLIALMANTCPKVTEAMTKQALSHTFTLALHVAKRWTVSHAFSQKPPE